MRNITAVATLVLFMAGASLVSAQGRQDTGISDPSVNPGQAAGGLTVQGEVLLLQDGAYLMRSSGGRDVRLQIDKETQGDKDLKPGDWIEAQVTPQGRVTSIKKAPRQ